jgi:Patatin-like phospholipase
MSANTPFGTIALCLSGGGYRAAAFHLGTIDMLNKLGLLENVKLLSTVSGGTLLGMSYAAWRVDEDNLANFQIFYEEFYKFLKDKDIIKVALEKLDDEAKRKPEKNVSLIRTAADVYDESLPYAKNNLFGHFFDEKRHIKPPFNDLIFNATEFLRGNSFRFRASQIQGIVIGNKFFNIDIKSAESLRLADIAAASSCFPGGFEPLIFPEDFNWHTESKFNLTPTLIDRFAAYFSQMEIHYAGFESGSNTPVPVRPQSEPAKTSKTIYAREILLEDYIIRLDKYFYLLDKYINKPDKDETDKPPIKPHSDFFNENLTAKCDEYGKPVSVPLMDGGIFDNQGINSILLADKYPNDIDVFIISDTSQRDYEMLKPEEKFDLAKVLDVNENGTFGKIGRANIASFAGALWKYVGWASVIAVGFSLVYITALVYKIFKIVTNTEFTAAAGVSLVIFYMLPLAALCGILFGVYKLFLAKKRFIAWFDKKSVIDFKGATFELTGLIETLTVNDVGNLLMTRLKSLLTMSANVFMKAIRGNQFENIFNKVSIGLLEHNPALTKETAGRVSSNLIYNLNPTEAKNVWTRDPDLEPTKRMREISKNAENVGTTLWFGTNSKALEGVVLCGKITICSSLMTFLLEQRGTNPNDDKSPYYDLYWRIKNEWNEFRKLV